MRGMKEAEMMQIANFIKRVGEVVSVFDYVEDKEGRSKTLKLFHEFITTNIDLLNIRDEVRELCLKFPIYSKI